jgi:hypothetical protein
MTPQERAELIADLKEALNVAPVQQLSDEEHQWVKMAIQKEAQSIALRQAIIEKSLSSLVWSAIVGLGIVLLEYLRNHGLRL